jgi:hypothetical protein
MGDIQMLDVKFSHLELLRSVVKSATDLEKQDHRVNADEKAATQLLMLARSADLIMDDEMKQEVQEKLQAGTKR